MPHIRFKDEEDDDVDMADVGEDHLGGSRVEKLEAEERFQSSSASVSGCDLRKPDRRLSIGGQAGKPDYVFDIAVNHDATLAAVSTSASVVKLLSVVGLKPVAELRGHCGTVSSISFLPHQPNLLLSSSADGSVRFWDVRTAHETQRFSGQGNDEMWSASVGGVSGNLVAGASNAKIYFWDMRMGSSSSSTMAILEEAHTEEVVQVSFHPEAPDTLLSASVDGLICVLKTDAAIDDEESLQMVMNVGTSVSKFGFYGPSLESLWCLTHIETFSLWRWAEGEQWTEAVGTRDLVAKQWELPTVDYFIRCCELGGAGQGLVLLGGTSEGAFGLFKISPSQGPAKVVEVEKVGMVCRGGHSGVVRAAEPIVIMGKAHCHEDVQWLSGGEDGHVFAWGTQVLNQAPSLNTKMQSMKQSERSKGRYSPY